MLSVHSLKAIQRVSQNLLKIIVNRVIVKTVQRVHQLLRVSLMLRHVSVTAIS